VTGDANARADAAAHIDAGHVTLAITVLRQLLDSRVHSDDHEARLLLARALLRAGRDREAGEVALAVLENDDVPPATRALAAAVTGHAAAIDNDPSADGLLEEAMRIEGGLGIASTLAWGAATVRRYWLGDMEGAVRAATSAVHASAIAPPVEREDARTVLAAMLMHADRFDEALTVLTSNGSESAEDIPPVAQSLRDRVLGALHFHAGRWDDAIAVLDSRRDAARGIEITDHDRALATGLLVVLLVHRDRLNEADSLLATGVPLMASGQGALLLWGAALLAEARGQIAVAADLADRLASKLDQLGCPVRYRLVGPDLVRLRLAVGDQVVPMSVVHVLDEVAAIADVPSITASALLSRGLIEHDPAAMQRACHLLESSPRVLDEALALDAYGTALAQTNTEAAVDIDRRARSLYVSLGARRDVRRIDERLRLRGIAPGRPLVETTLIEGYSELSPTEAAVAALVGEGLTNAEIGRRLYVSSRTVETHVAHLFEKLGVKRRAAIAGLVARSRPD
jgi:DNA-binding NarL/FixJ family response regulator